MCTAHCVSCMHTRARISLTHMGILATPLNILSARSFGQGKKGPNRTCLVHRRIDHFRRYERAKCVADGVCENYPNRFEYANILYILWKFHVFSTWKQAYSKSLSKVRHLGKLMSAMERLFQGVCASSTMLSRNCANCQSILFAKSSVILVILTECPPLAGPKCYLSLSEITQATFRRQKPRTVSALRHQRVFGAAVCTSISILEILPDRWCPIPIAVCRLLLAFSLSLFPRVSTHGHTVRYRAYWKYARAHARTRTHTL